MKKIAYLIPSFPVYSETFIGTEIRAMEHLGYDVCLMAFNNELLTIQPQDKPFIKRTYYLSQYSLRLNSLLLTKQSRLLTALVFLWKQKGIAKLSLFYSALKVASIIKKNNCQHIHAHFAQASTATAIIAARLTGITVSFVGHGHDVYESPSDLALKLDYSDLVIAVCQQMYDDFKRLNTQANVALVYCGVELERFKDGRALLLSSQGKKSQHLLFIGRLVETKGVDDIISAMMIIPKKKRPIIDIVGEGELRRYLEQIVKLNQLENNIIFLGKKLNSWLVANSFRYRAMICPFKISQTGNRDTGPVVVKEAMALGLPVISTYFMGCNEMITEKTGLRVNPNDATALAKAIVIMMSMSEKDWLLMSMAAYQRVKECFTSSYQAKIMSKNIEKLSI